MAEKLKFSGGNLCIYDCLIDAREKKTKFAPIRDGFCVEFCHVFSRFYLRKRIHAPDSVIRIDLKD